MKFVIVTALCLLGKSNELIVKRLTLVDDGKNSRTYLFEPPYQWNEIPEDIQRTNRWIVKHLHGIEWSCGHIPYRKLQNILLALCKNINTVFTKGIDQTELLSHHLVGKTMIDLDAIGWSGHVQLTGNC